MKEIIDGVIKYDRGHFQESNPLNSSEYADLEYWRKKLYELKLIGEYEDLKVGFGNLSQKKDYSQVLKTNNPQFLISGTQTGKYKDLNGKHYTRVLDFNLQENIIQVNGPIEASSEALTHASIYQCNNLIQSVFHIHDKVIWQKMLESNYDKTAKDIAYGTYDMAIAVKKSISGKTSGVIVMEGHEDGVIAYAESLDQCGEIILEIYKKFR